MAKRKIEVELGFKVQSQQAKQALQELNNSINQIGNGVNLDLSKGLTDDIWEGVRAAQALQTALQKATNVDTGKIDLAKFSQSMRQANMSIEKTRQQLQGLGPLGGEIFTNFARAIQQAEVPIFRISNGLKKLGTTLANTFRWQLSSTFLNSITSGIQGAITYAQDLNESLNNIRIVTGYSADKMSEFAVEANKAAKALSATTNEYAKASLIYFQQGLSDDEVVKRTETTLKLAKVTGETAETTSEWMTAIWNNFDNGSKSLEYYADVMTKLGAATASSSDEIAGGLEKFAAISKTIGLSYEYAAAALATVTATTRQSEDVVGTAFKTIFGRMEGLTLGQTLDDGTSLNKYSSALASVGVNIKDASGELKDMDTILSELGNKWDNLGRSQKVALAQVVGGMRQYNQLIALMDSWDFFEQNLELAKGATGELDAQFSIYEESWEAASNRVKASAESIYEQLLDDETFIKLTDSLANFLDIINSAIDSIGGLKGALLLIGGIVTQIFQKEITQGIQSVMLSMTTLTKKGRQMYENQKQEALGQLSKLDSGSTLQDQASFEAVSDEASIRKKINANSTAISDDMKAELEEEIKLLQVLENQKIENAKILQQKQDEAAILGAIVKKAEEAKQAAQDEVNIKKQGVSNSVMYLEHAVAKTGSPGVDYSKVNSAINDFKIVLNNANSSVDDYNHSLSNLEKELNDAGLSSQQVAKALDLIKQSTTEVISETKILEAREEALTNRLNEQAEAIQAEKTATDNYNKSNKAAAKGVKKLSSNVDLAAQSTKSFSEVMVGAASAGMQFMSLITILSSAFSNLNDENLSTTDKLVSVFTALATTLPIIINLYKSLSSEMNKNTISAIKNAIANKVAGGSAKQPVDINTLKKGEFKVGNNRYFKTADSKGRTIWNAEDAQGKISRIGKKDAQAAFNQSTQKGSSFGKGAKAGGYAALAIAAAAVTIAAFDYAINRFDKEAKKAEKAAEDLNQQFQVTKQNFESLKQSMASYKDARKGIDELTRGTKEYNEAIRTANDQAMELIKNNKDLKWSYNSEGVIEIDEESMEKLEQDKEAQMKQQQAAALRAQAEATEKRNKANDVEFARQKMGGASDRAKSGAAGAGGGLVGGVAAGAAMGAAIGSVIPGIGTIAGLGIGALGAIIGGAIGVTAGGAVGASTGWATEHEKEGLEKLREEYERLSKEGRESELKTKEGIIDALGPEFADLADALTKNVDATYELISSQAELLNQQRLARLSSVDAVLSKNEEYTNSKYKGIMNQQMVNAIYNDPEYQSKLEDEIENVNDELRSFWNTDEALAEAWAKEVLNVESDNIEFSELAGDEFKYRIKNADGSWGELQTAYKEDIAKQIAEQRLLEQGATDEKIKEFQEENQRRESDLLAKANIYDEDERLALMMQAAENAVEGDNTQYLTNLSKYTAEEIEAIRQSGFDVSKALENRQKDIDSTNEKLAKRGTSLQELLGTDNLDDITAEESLAIEKIEGNIFSSIGSSGQDYISQLLQGQSAENRMKMLKALSSYDWQSVDDPVATLSHTFDELGITINEDAAGALTNLANSMDEANDASMLLGNGFENMCKKITEALKTVKGLTSGSILDAETYKNLIKTYPSLEKFFAKTAEGYKSFVSQEELEKHVRNSLEKNTITAIQATRKLYNYWDMDTTEGETMVKATSQAIDTLNDYTIENEDAFNEEFAKFIETLPAEVLQAMGTNADSLNNQKFDEKQTWLASLMSMTNVEGLDKNIRDATTTLIDNQKFTSREEAERYLRALDSTLTEEALNEYLDRWDAEFTKNAFNEFFDEIENGLAMKQLSAQSKDLEKALNNLEGAAWSAAKELEIRGQQINNLESQISKYSAEMSNLIKSEQEILAMNEDYQKQYYENLSKVIQNLETFETELKELNSSLPKMMTHIFEKAAEAFDKIDKKISYTKNVASAYQNIAELGGRFTGTDTKLMKSISDAQQQASLTNIANTKNKYEAYVEARQKLQAEYEAEKAAGNIINEEEWKAEFEKIDSLVDEAHVNFLNSWASAMEEAKQIYETNIGRIFDNYKKELENIRTQYDRQKTLSDLYIKDYEKTYELNKLNREVLAKLEETDSLKARQKLLDIQKKINYYQQESVEMSEYDLQLLQKYYELELAQIALEEAQRAKNQVQLTRRADGTWGYIYTADESKITDAEQEIEDKYFALQQMTDEYLTKLNEQSITLRENWLAAIEAIWMDETLTPEARDEAIASANKYFNELGNAYLNEFNKITGDNNPFAQDFANNVVAPIIGANGGLSQIASGLKTFINTEISSTAEGGLLNSLNAEFTDYYNKNKAILSEAGTSFSDYKDQISTAINGSGDGKNTGLTDILNGLEDTSDQVWNDMGEDVKGFNDTIQNLLPTIQANLALIQQYLKDAKAAADAIAGQTARGLAISTAQQEINAAKQAAEEALMAYGEDSTQYQQAVAMISKAERLLNDLINEKDETKFNKILDNIVGTDETMGYTDRATRWATATSSDNSSGDNTRKPATPSPTAAGKPAETTPTDTGKSTGPKLTEIKPIETPIESGKAYPVYFSQYGEGGWNEDIQTKDIGNTTYLHLSVEGWDDIWFNADDVDYQTSGSMRAGSIDNGARAYKITELATGGYTGSWGPEGRWAMLHQKEIVLNAHDTENFLAAINILRQLVDTIDLRAVERSFGETLFKQLSTNNINNTSSTVAQDVKIYAEFPNATNHNEIEEAFNNLVNSASQYANRK